MSFLRLLIRSLLFHWRGNLAIILGVTVGTAVLTGALLVGDSLRGSLKVLTEKRLGWVDQSLVSDRFFRESIAKELVEKKAAAHAAPVILLQATAEIPSEENGNPSASARARKTSLLGVDNRYWRGQDPTIDGDLSDPQNEIGFLNTPLADALGANVGDRVTFHVRKQSDISEESLFGRKKTGTALSSITFIVGAILDPSHSMASFKLSPDPQPARNAFVPLSLLQQKLELDKEGDQRVNGLLVQGGTEALGSTLRSVLTLEDYELILRTPSTRAQGLMAINDRVKQQGGLRRLDWRGRLPAATAKKIDTDNNNFLSEDEIKQFYRKERAYLSLESERLMLQPATAQAVTGAAKKANLHAAPTMVYLANSIHPVDKPENEIPYSVIAALDPSMKKPLGPFLPNGINELKDDEIVLIEWPDSPLDVKPGDKIRVRYFEPEHQGRPREKHADFRLKGFVPLQGASADAGLTPNFPGITDQLTLRRWDPPFPYDNRRIKRRDDQFWEDYRTTPKAYITLAKGKELWESRFGELTSIRMAPEKEQALKEAEAAFRKELLAALQPEQSGFVFHPIRQESLEASQGGGFDFGMLFVGFSFFLIIAALLLVGLLFRLSLDRRASEIGLLYAVGMSRKTVRRLLLSEGGAMALIGGAIGTVVAVLYAGLLLDYLRGAWKGEGNLFFLERHVEPKTLIIGYVATFLMSLITIYWALRALGKLSPRGLLHGQTVQPQLVTQGPPKKRIIASGISLVLGLVLLVAGMFVKQHEAQAGTFFGSGSMLLIGGLCILSAWLGSSRQASVHGGGPWAVALLGARNAGRHSTRSLLTAGLLASAAFLLVAVECFRRQPGEDFLKKDAGSGGYALLAESDLPIVTDFNSEAGREELRNRLELVYNKAEDASEPDPTNPEKTRLEARLDRAMALLQETEIQAFRAREGDDASCLNLYQPRNPRVMAVPQALIDRGGFAFSATEGDPESPWTLLEAKGESVPVFGEQNTVIWMLKAGLGDTLSLQDDQGKAYSARISALLHDSVFQSSLLMSEANFKRLYPQHVGFHFFLISPPNGKEKDITEILQTALSERGLEVTPTAERLQQYLAVENMYLSTFQALGGMGLLLGSLGLVVVLLRSVWERRAELALLRALGFRRRTIGWLVLSENGFLLLLGLGLGTIAALISVAPHVLGSGGKVEWLSLFRTLALVLGVGLLTIVLAVGSTVRASLIPALRKE